MIRDHSHCGATKRNNRKRRSLSGYSHKGALHLTSERGVGNSHLYTSRASRSTASFSLSRPGFWIHWRQESEFREFAIMLTICNVPLPRCFSSHCSLHLALNLLLAYLSRSILLANCHSRQGRPGLGLSFGEQLLKPLGDISVGE